MNLETEKARDAKRFPRKALRSNRVDFERLLHSPSNAGIRFQRGVYENSLAIELIKLGLKVDQQSEIVVFYEGRKVGVYFADLIVNDVVILELKALKQLAEEHEAQLLNYLKATRIEVGLLLNFGPRPDVRRRVYDNERKGSFAWIDEEHREKLDTEYTDDTARTEEG